MPDRRPTPDTLAPFHAPYLARVPDGDIRATLAADFDAHTALLAGADPDHAYAPGKWTVRQVVQHLADAERIFATRALRIARGDETPLPGFDHDAFAETTAPDRRPLASVVDEWRAVRAATLALFDGLPTPAWERVGKANGHPVSVRALAWITAGHARHHADLLAERYDLG